MTGGISLVEVNMATLELEVYADQLWSSFRERERTVGLGSVSVGGKEGNKVDPELRFLMLLCGLGLGDPAQNTVENSKVLQKQRQRLCQLQHVDACAVICILVKELV